jgi:NitT/TauT family transport system substrate-binding protein
MTNTRSSTMTSRRTFLRHSAGVGLAVAAGIRTGPARAAMQKVDFQLDWIPYGRHAPYYTALEKGFYASKGLDVSIEQGRGATQGFARLIAGQTQFLFQDVGVMMGVRAKQGAKVEALACMYQTTPHTVFYIKGRGISKPKDLEGKKIAFSPGDSPKLMFPAFAKANGIDESKIHWLSVDPNSKNAVLLNHQVDAMLTYVFTLPVLQKAAQGGDVVETFVYGDYGADFYSNGLMAMESYAKKNPEITRGFVQATMQGVKYTIEHPEEAIKFLKKHQPQLDEQTALKEIPILRKLTNYDHIKGPLGSMSTEKMQATQDLLIKYLGLKNPPPVAELFTNKFLS